MSAMLASTAWFDETLWAWHGAAALTTGALEKQNNLRRQHADCVVGKKAGYALSHAGTAHHKPIPRLAKHVRIPSRQKS